MFMYGCTNVCMCERPAVSYRLIVSMFFLSLVLKLSHSQAQMTLVMCTQMRLSHWLSTQV